MSDRNNEGDGFEPIHLSDIQEAAYEEVFNTPDNERRFESLQGEGAAPADPFTEVFAGGAPPQAPPDASAAPAGGEGPVDPMANPQAPSPEAPQDPAQEAEALQRLQEEAMRLELEQKAQEEGFALGKAEGYEAGHAEGKEAAYAEGFAQGEKEGLEAGFAKGEVDGFEAARADAAQRLDALAAIAGQVESLWKNLVAANEEQLVRLVAKVAERVVLGHVATDNEVVKRAILEAFSMIPEPVEVTINVSPEDYAYIEVVKEEFFQQVRELKQVSVVSDPSVGRGGARIETAAGEVDTGIEARLEAVTRALMQAR